MGSSTGSDGDMPIAPDSLPLNNWSAIEGNAPPVVLIAEMLTV